MLAEPTYVQRFPHRVLDSVSTKIKVLCLSLWYPLSMSRYFEKALRHRYDVELITTGVYTGSWIPWLGGMNVPEKYAIPPDLPLPFRNDIGQINYDLIRAMLPAGWVPDITLCIDAGIHWKYKPPEGLVVHIATDPHALNYDYQRSISDKFFNMQACYSQQGDIYLPYAYSQYDHYPMWEVPEQATSYYPDRQVIKDTDAVLIGMPYAHRVQWVDELRKRGVSVIFENGPIFDEARALYNRGRIGLNWSSLNDLNARAFEIPAMKLYPVVNFVPDMERHESLYYHSTFQDLNEAIEMVMYAKEHPEETKELAEKAYQAIQGQTYDARISQLLDECGFA